MPTKLSIKDKSEVEKLVHEGHKFTEIGALFDCTARTVSNFCKQHGIVKYSTVNLY